MNTKLEKKARIHQKREYKKRLLNATSNNGLSDCYSVILSNIQYFTDQDINNAALVSKTFYNIISDKYYKIKIVRLIVYHKNGGKVLENAFMIPDKSLYLTKSNML